MYNAVAYALNNAVAPTDISVQSEAGSAGSQADVVFNTYSTVGMTTSRRRNLACHETGHSLGFPHPASTSGCIGSTTILTYSSHEINDHINPHYN
jgi:hypothetical protein